MNLKEFLNNYEITSIDIVKITDKDGNIIAEFDPPIGWYKDFSAEFETETDVYEREVVINGD